MHMAYRHLTATTVLSGLFMLLLSMPNLANEKKQEAEKQAIAERLKPAGDVYSEADLKDVPGLGAPKPAPSKKSGPRSGQAIYESACFACHGAGVLGAPKLQDATDWKPRMGQGFDTLLKHAINGIGAMPPRGTCADCSDEEIGEAIKYMIKGL